jgi:hypothetical protein
MEIQKNEIIELERKLVQGIKTSNVQFLDKILHDDLLFLAPNGQVITKAIDLASHEAGEMVVDTITSTLEEIKIFDDIAIVVIVYDTKGKMLGNPIQGQFRYIRMWKSFNDGYRVIGGSSSKL